MNYLRRKMDERLLVWKRDERRLPLVVKGARQVGKTESIRAFARANYTRFVEINFAEEPRFREVVQDGYATRDVLRNLTRIEPSIRLEPGRTLFFFDEIQEFPDIASTLKFLAQDGRFDVICSGSLLGVHYKRISHVGVGYKTELTMESMDFEEFLWARGYQEAFIEDVLASLVARRPLGAAETTALSRLFLDYCVLGGMPAAVSRYFENGTFEGILGVQRDIVADYKDDMRKYAEGVDQARLLNVFNRIPVQLAAENKKFQISKVAKDARFKDYRGCIDWICDAGIARRCHCLSFPASPLRGNFDPDRFKLYLADTGLLVSLLDDETQHDVRANRNLGGYKGGLFENIVGEALAKQGYDLFYYKREDSTLEEDFFVRAGDDVVPVEVKSTRGRSKSLRTLINSDHYPDIRWGVKFTSGNVGFENRILTIPYYTAFLLRRILERGAPLP